MVMPMFLNKIKDVNKDNKKILGFFIGFLLLLFIIFYKERNIFLILKFYFGLLYLFMLPGFLILSSLFNKLRVFDRLLLSLQFGTAMIGVLTFLLYTYLGLKVKIMIYFPLVIFLIFIIMIVIKKKTK